jgi:hypothetical protein
MTSTRAAALSALFVVASLSPAPAHAIPYELSVTGKIGENNSADASIPVGSLFSFQLVYDTAAPDLDVDLTTTPDPTFGRFTNTGATPALLSFHYQAASYEVTISDPAGFGPFSDFLVTFVANTGVYAFDINIRNSDPFPLIAGNPVTFHADFNQFSPPPISGSDGLPTDQSLTAASFGESTVSLFPGFAVISGTEITSLSIHPVPEASVLSLAVLGLLGLAARRSVGSRH